MRSQGKRPLAGFVGFHFSGPCALARCESVKALSHAKQKCKQI
jgi:hypothetical protein